MIIALISLDMQNVYSECCRVYVGISLQLNHMTDFFGGKSCILG